jgi:AT-binding transcription factor 1
LETHLQAKHADQFSKGDINIDAIPDEEVVESASSPLGDNTKVPTNYGANSTNSLGAVTSPSMAPFLHSLSTHGELESSLKKLYEESLKRYAKDVEAASQNGATPNEMRLIKSEIPSPSSASGNPTGGDCPLDLSKPVDLTRALGKTEPMDTSIFDQDYLSGMKISESFLYMCSLTLLPPVHCTTCHDLCCNTFI